MTCVGLASGPRSGLGEISIPENEARAVPSCRARSTRRNAKRSRCCAAKCSATMSRSSFGGASGKFRVPQRIQADDRFHNFLQSCAVARRRHGQFRGALRARASAPMKDRIAELMQRSLMLVTALTPHIELRQGGRNRQARAQGRQHPEGSRARAGLRERRRFRAAGSGPPT